MLLFVIKQVSQSRGWHHAVVSVHVDGVTRIGTANIYFDGKRVGRTVIDSKFTSYPDNCACRFFPNHVQDLHQHIQSAAN